jgi:hypothetical protein
METTVVAKKKQINLYVARVRRHGENIHPQNLSYVANVWRQGILIFY